MKEEQAPVASQSSSSSSSQAFHHSSLDQQSQQSKTSVHTGRTGTSTSTITGTYYSNASNSLDYNQANQHSSRSDGNSGNLRQDRTAEKSGAAAHTGTVDVIGILNGKTSSSSSLHSLSPSLPSLATSEVFSSTQNNNGAKPDTPSTSYSRRINVAHNNSNPNSATTTPSSNQKPPMPSPSPSSSYKNKMNINFFPRHNYSTSNSKATKNKPIPKVPKTGIKYNDETTYNNINNNGISKSNSSSEFPAIEVRIASSMSVHSDDDEEYIDHRNPSPSNNSAPYTATNNNNNYDKISLASSYQSSTTIFEDKSRDVSPLTPRGDENEDDDDEFAISEKKKLHRRMSSSDRLMKMLDDLNKKQPFDVVTDYKDDDVDDDDSDGSNVCATTMEVMNSSKQSLLQTKRTGHHIHNMNEHNAISSGTDGYTTSGSGVGGERLNTRSATLPQGHENQSTFSASSTLSSSIMRGGNGVGRNTEYSTLPRLPPKGSHGQIKQSSNTCIRRKQEAAMYIYAQSFVMGVAFFFVWTPQNLMAPNLTQMADYFHFTHDQRDLYLGANIALATGVLSLPVSALLGFLADVVSSRILLFAGTVFMGGIFSICTGLSETYTQLYFARFGSGGCMAGSVVIAFSILGDFFDAKDRNAASSGLTAMMGGGILLGQVFAGTVGDLYNWKIPFYVSGMCTVLASFMVILFVREPVRGGKEKVLQEMIASGKKYDRKLTMKGFIHAMTKNKTNVILMVQGFTTNVPWGIIFTFLNDYLSQEKGLSVPASTFLVLVFGLSCASGGVAGGLFGSYCVRINRSILPLFMAGMTFLSTFPFLGLLDFGYTSPNLLVICLCALSGFIANLPSVNVRPCILNVNPPETRGAAMTANNLMVNVARGAGPSLITLSQSFFGVSRQYSFNVTIIVFWAITTILLLILAKTLPNDQDNMEKELAKYVEAILKNAQTANSQFSYKDADSPVFDDAERFKILDDDLTQYGNESIVSIEDRMSSFDAAAARESWSFIEDALREIAILSTSKIHPDDEAIEPFEGTVWDGSMEENEQNEVEKNDGKRFSELDTLL